MTTDWHGSELATGFEAFDGLTERTVGFPVLFEELRLGAADVRAVLDYGCGPGKTAVLVAERYGVTVTAVDVSAAMLRIATEQYAHPRVSYGLLERAGLPDVDDGSIDAAMACFVFINVPDVAELDAIANAVHRVLRPGGRFVLMDSNPDAVGVRFTTFQTGEPGRAYAAGEARRVQLHDPETQLEIIDYHWPSVTYERVLKRAGFARVSMRRPLLATRSARAPAESRHPPLLIVTAEK
jgi:ubiquinone/menaquinone biosynthesis C-methylase UbiE